MGTEAAPAGGSDPQALLAQELKRLNFGPDDYMFTFKVELCTNTVRRRWRRRRRSNWGLRACVRACRSTSPERMELPWLAISAPRLHIFVLSCLMTGKLGRPEAQMGGFAGGKDGGDPQISVPPPAEGPWNLSLARRGTRESSWTQSLGRKGSRRPSKRERGTITDTLSTCRGRRRRDRVAGLANTAAAPRLPPTPPKKNNRQSTTGFPAPTPTRERRRRGATRAPTTTSASSARTFGG